MNNPGSSSDALAEPISSGLGRFLPGVTLVAIVTAAAYGLRQVPGLSGLSPMFSAILVGMLFAHFTTVPSLAGPGISLLGKRMLRLAVALLGLQLTLSQVFELGATGMLGLVTIVLATYIFTVAAGRLLGVGASLARLLAAGTSICGASAIAAANAVEQARDEDVSYAITCITLFGTLAIALYPMACIGLGLDDAAFGFWVGASIHEVAQVVATGFQQGESSGEFAVIVKLSRVLLLAPLLLAVTLLAARRRAMGGSQMAAHQVVPIFVAGFVGLMIANSIGLVPEAVRHAAGQVTPVMLTAALAALGLGTSFGALRDQGVRPLVLAGLASAFIGGTSLMILPLL